MPLPTAAIDAQQAVMTSSYSSLITALSTALNIRGQVLLDAALVVTAQATYDAALAAWIADGSPGSGSTFNAKVSAQTALTSAQGDLAIDTTSAATAEAALTVERKAFARAVAQMALVLGEASGYAPPTSPARVFDLVYQVAFGLAPTF